MPRFPLFALAAALALPAATFAGSVDFNTPGDLGVRALESGQNFDWTPFTTSTTFPSEVNNIFEADGVGINGTRGLGVLTADPFPTAGGTADVADQTHVTYIGPDSAFSFLPGQTVTTSIFFKKANGLNLSRRFFDIGFLPDSDADTVNFLNAIHAGVRVRGNGVNGLTLQYRINNADLGAQTANVLLTTGNWYKISFSLTSNNDGTMTLDSWVDDYGASGLSLVTANVIDHTALNTTTTQGGAWAAADPDNVVYGGLRVRNESFQNGISAFDDFSVTGTPAIPVPAAALMGLPMLGAVALLRRRK